MTITTDHQQLSLFPSRTPAQGKEGIPIAIQKAMEIGAALAISISGGKDSDAMLRHLAAIHQAQQWSGELFAITADLGRIEWPGTIEHIRAVCNELSIRLVVVRRQKGGMIERWDERRQVLVKQQQETKRAIAHSTEGDKPFWSSSAARYCTKELKTAEVDRYLRKFKAVVCAVGIRAEESHSRAKKPHYQVRNDITTAALKASRGMTAEQHEAWASDAIAQWVKSDYKGRLALTWNAVLDWPIERVWKRLGTTIEELEHRRTLYQDGRLLAALRGWPAHWAYVSGNSRLSCSMCVLASAADIQNGANHNLATWLELALMETQSGWSFQQGKWLSTLAIKPSERLQVTRHLLTTLYRLELLQRWGALFEIALLSKVPPRILMYWIDDTHIALATAVKQQKSMPQKLL